MVSYESFRPKQYFMATYSDQVSLHSYLYELINIMLTIFFVATVLLWPFKSVLTIKGKGGSTGLTKYTFDFSTLLTSARQSAEVFQKDANKINVQELIIDT